MIWKIPNFICGHREGHSMYISINDMKNPKLHLRTPQRPHPVFNPNRVSVHFTFCCHECTHFAWLIHTYVEACESNTLLWSVVQLYSHNVIQSVYTCTAFCCYKCTHFALYKWCTYHLLPVFSINIESEYLWYSRIGCNRKWLNHHRLLSQPNSTSTRVWVTT